MGYDNLLENTGIKANYQTDLEGWNTILQREDDDLKALAKDTLDANQDAN